MENKPMSVVLSEVKNGIIGILNQSGLPIYVEEMLLREILTDVSHISNQVREREYQEYMEMEKQTTKESSNSKKADK